MGKELVDARGTVIKLADKVVYNRSGNLTTGVVNRIVAKWSEYPYIKGRWYFSGFIDIENDEDGKMSRVRNLGSIIVINQELLK